MALVLNGSGTIQSDDITLSGNANVTGAFAVTGDMGIAAADLPTGSILQVVQGSNTTQLITTSTSYVDTGLSASITPSSTSSKILVIVSHPTCEKRNDDAYNSINFRLLREATVISSDPIAYGIGQTAPTVMSLMFSVSFNYLDSPSTTSAITYKTQIHNSSGTGQIKVQRSDAPSTITLIEVAG